MILETAILTIRPGADAAFEAAMKQAWPLIAASPGFHDLELRPCLENAHRYLLLVRWRTLEDHTVGFRQSERYAQWRGLLHGFYEPFPVVEHYGAPLALALEV
jgi:heme-degrading monooxygenase HmoA